jgi:Cu2+-exporting ATPase
LISGESVPVSAAVGDPVLAGVINVASPIEVRVEATGGDSRIGKVMQSVESAAAEKTPIVLLADRIGGYFVVCVMALAVATFAFWARSDLGAATLNSTALLIVACPCALALATPLAIAVSLGRAAGMGVLVRSGDAIQKLSGTGQIWLDKTGTLTEGKQRVTSYFGDARALQLAAALEENCLHPVAKAIVQHTNDRRLAFDDLQVEDQSVVAGGITGQVDRNEIVAGNQPLLAAHLSLTTPGLGLNAGSPKANRTWAELAEELADGGESPILISVNGQVRALVGISDPIREDAAETVQRLKSMSWKVGILSGDHRAIVHRVAKKVGVELADCTGGMTPEDKLAVVRAAHGVTAESPGGTSGAVRDDETVVMVGDGANDAAALAAADVGIAIRGGAEVSLQAAEIFVAGGQLGRISDLIQGSRRTHRLIIAALTVSLGYNLFAVTLAVLGWISPLLAAILMPLSSVSVLALILSARTFPNNTQKTYPSNVPSKTLSSARRPALG